MGASPLRSRAAQIDVGRPLLRMRLEPRDDRPRSTAAIRSMEDLPSRVTCLVDSTTSNWHVHFVDGAGAGYTSAAKIMKDKLARRRAA